MRYIIPTLAVSLFAFGAQAQTSTQTTPAPSPPAATAPASTAPATAADTAAPARHARSHMTLQQRFDQANTTHDGHLTLEQAKAGMPMVAKHFDAIDKDKKGYVTTEDIHSYASQRRAAHHAGTHHTSSPS
jgi:hypothetical protein